MVRFRFRTGILPLFLALAASAAGTLPRGSSAADPARSPAGGEAFVPDRRAFLEALRERRHRVADFAFLNEWGTARGVRVFAAGGTAAGLAHYVKDDLERESLERAGKPSPFFKSRFGYDYYDVYRSTQDADIVIDIPGGDAEAHERAAAELEKEMMEKFGHLQGAKSVWEVRFLRLGRGEAGTPGHKDALLSKDFREQNSDSHSTGLVELTNPTRGEPPRPLVLDVRDWESRDAPQFLRDVLEDKIRFYASANHFGTRRAMGGMNPEILSVIRYFGKSFQYGCTGYPEDEAEIARIIREFDPRTPVSGYVRKQIEGNGLKLYWHSQDVEVSEKVLERSGLRAKLIAFGDPAKAGTMSAWIARRALASYPLGQGPVRVSGASGLTAAQLKLSVVSHETNQMLAYESILRSRAGRPNVLISRADAPGEAAVHGDGYYNRVGTRGARGTGLTIRSILDPRAVDGIDFHYLEGLQFVIVLNRNAIRIKEESIDVTPLNYFRLLFDQEGIDQSNRGLYEMFSRKVRLRTGGAADLAEIAKEVEKYLASMEERRDLLPKRGSSLEPLARWFELPGSADYPELGMRALRLGSGVTPVRQAIFANPAWGLSRRLLDAGAPVHDAVPRIFAFLASQPRWLDSAVFREWLRARLPSAGAGSETLSIQRAILGLAMEERITVDRYFSATEIFEILLASEDAAWLRATETFYSRLAEVIDRSGKAEQDRIAALFRAAVAGQSEARLAASAVWYRTALSADHPELARKVFANADLEEVQALILLNPKWKPDIRRLKACLLDGKTQGLRSSVFPVVRILESPHWRENAAAHAWIGRLVARGASYDMPVQFSGEQVPRSTRYYYRDEIFKLLRKSPAWRTEALRIGILEKFPYDRPHFFLEPSLWSATQIADSLARLAAEFGRSDIRRDALRLAPFLQGIWELGKESQATLIYRDIARSPELYDAVFRSIFLDLRLAQPRDLRSIDPDYVTKNFDRILRTVLTLHDAAVAPEQRSALADVVSRWLLDPTEETTRRALRSEFGEVPDYAALIVQARKRTCPRVLRAGG